MVLPRCGGRRRSAWRMGRDHRIAPRRRSQNGGYGMARQPLELLKGTLDVVILQTLSAGALHGYGISRWVREATDEDFSIDEGALYPALRRLERKGYVEAEWGV